MKNLANHETEPKQADKFPFPENVTHWQLFGSNMELLTDCYFQTEKEFDLAKLCLYRIAASLGLTSPACIPPEIGEFNKSVVLYNNLQPVLYLIIHEKK